MARCVSKVVHEAVAEVVERIRDQATEELGGLSFRLPCQYTADEGQSQEGSQLRPISDNLCSGGGQQGRHSTALQATGAGGDHGIANLHIHRERERVGESQSVLRLFMINPMIPPAPVRCRQARTEPQGAGEVLDVLRGLELRHAGREHGRKHPDLMICGRHLSQACELEAYNMSERHISPSGGRVDCDNACARGEVGGSAVQHRLSGLAHDDVGVLAQKEEGPAGELDELLEEWRLAAAQHVQVCLRERQLRVRGEIMESQAYRTV
eukprot:COSAG01_NODE_19041_length_1034_cov_236.321925_1_plen_266_part_10